MNSNKNLIKSSFASSKSENNPTILANLSK